MRPFITRRCRRAKRVKTEGSFFKKESHEQTFFGEPVHNVFFPSLASSLSPNIQRKCEKCEEEKTVMRAEGKKEEEKDKIQRQAGPKEDEKDKVQRQAAEKEEDKDKMVQKKESNTSASASTNTSAYISTLSGKGQPLPAATNYFFSSRMGYDFNNVKIHNDKEAAHSANNINAKAYTIGNNIVFNEGQYNTESSEGKKLLAHELAHVVQQQNERSAAGTDETVHRKITYSLPDYKKEDPIPKILGSTGVRLGETFITINGQKPLKRLDVIQAVFEAFNKNLTLSHDPATKTCTVNTDDIKIDISAKITLVTDPVADKWSGTYPGHLVKGSYVCSKLPSVNVEMVSNPSGGAALQKAISKDESQHFTDIIDVSEKHIEAFHSYLENLRIASDTANDCPANFSTEIGTKDIDMAAAFADDWLLAVNRHDDPATGTHHYRSSTDPTNCNLVKITVSF